MCEGSYPYVTGGVSSWVHMLITSLKDIEFNIASIVVDREHGGKFKYALPPNLTQIHEYYLLDDDHVRFLKTRRLSKKQKNAFRSFVMGKDIEWETIFDFFGNNEVSVNDLLMGVDIFDIVKEFYDQNYARLPFTDFLWTYRSMLLPICLLMKNRLPQADLYHSASTGYSGVQAVMAKMLYNKPAIITEHGIYTREREEDIIRSPEFNGLYKDIWIEHFYKLSGCAYGYCDKVISLYNGARDLQVELGCDKAKTLVIPNGVDPLRFDNLPQKTEDSVINLGILARVSPIKDIKTLISAYAVAHEKVPNLHLYIMGGIEEDSTAYYDECVDLAKNLKLDHVHFTGNINVSDYIGRMDMLILTSISEGQPIATLEAMAAGKPFICTRVGSCEELLYGKTPEEPHCGIITPIMSVADISRAIIELALDPAKRKQYGAAGRKRVDDEYRLDQVIRTYRNLYTTMVEGNTQFNPNA
jgi:glycosyltransferase involved in cell wall biosynthesis